MKKSILWICPQAEQCIEDKAKAILMCSTPREARGVNTKYKCIHMHPHRHFPSESEKDEFACDYFVCENYIGKLGRVTCVNIQENHIDGVINSGKGKRTLIL